MSGLVAVTICHLNDFWLLLLLLLLGTRCVRSAQHAGQRFFAAKHKSHALRKGKSMNPHIRWVASTRQAFRYSACRQLWCSSLMKASFLNGRSSSTEPGTCIKKPAMTTHLLTGSAAARASGSAGGTTRDA